MKTQAISNCVSGWEWEWVDLEIILPAPFWCFFPQPQVTPHMLCADQTHLKAGREPFAGPQSSPCAAVSSLVLCPMNYGICYLALIPEYFNSWIIFEYIYVPKLYLDCYPTRDEKRKFFSGRTLNIVSYVWL